MGIKRSFDRKMWKQLKALGKLVAKANSKASEARAS